MLQILCIQFYSAQNCPAWDEMVLIPWALPPYISPRWSEPGVAHIEEILPWLYILLISLDVDVALCFQGRSPNLCWGQGEGNSIHPSSGNCDHFPPRPTLIILCNLSDIAGDLSFHKVAGILLLAAFFTRTFQANVNITAKFLSAHLG